MMKLNKSFQSLLFNWPAKMLSLVFALLVYLFITYSTLGSRVVTIPLQVKLPENMVAESLVPTSVQVNIRGDEDIIYLVDPHAIEASLDYSYVKEAGIATSVVVLTYEQQVFNNAGISLVANPSDYRILFSKGSGS